MALNFIPHYSAHLSWFSRLVCSIYLYIRTIKTILYITTNFTIFRSRLQQGWKKYESCLNLFLWEHWSFHLPDITVSFIVPVSCFHLLPSSIDVLWKFHHAFVIRFSACWDTYTLHKKLCNMFKKKHCPKYIKTTYA